MKNIYKKWWIWLIIVLILLVVIIEILLKNNTSIQANANTINLSQNAIEYNVIKSAFENGGKKKTEKILVTNKLLTDEQIKKIYNDRKTLNKDIDLKIWLFSSQENLNNMDNAELAEAYEENGNLIIKNYEKEKQEEEQKQKQEEEQKQREEQEKIEEEQKQKQIEQERQEFKDSCNTYTFEQLARNPTKMIGTKVKLVGEVIQTMYDGNIVQLRVNITKEDGYYSDTVYVRYIIDDDRILEDDIITIYGTAMGEVSYTSILGAEITLPYIEAEYIDIN